MKTTKTALILAVALAGLTGASSVLAQHRHYHGGHGPRVSIGFGFGFPYAYPYYRPYYAAPYYAPYSYYSAPVVVQQAPVYIEQNPQPAVAPSAPLAQPVEPGNYWYYCAGSNGYYPYVKECPAGWQRVAPQPG